MRNVPNSRSPLKRPPHDFPDTRPLCHRRRRHSRPGDRLAIGRTARGQRQGQRRRHPGARQDRHRRRRQRHRLRRGPQQLFPARHARADGAQRRRLGIRSAGVQLPPGRLHADQPRGHARGCDQHLRAAEGDRLQLRVHRGREGLHDLHEGFAVGLARRRHHLRPAREEGRLRQQHRLRLRPGRARPRPTACAS